MLNGTFGGAAELRLWHVECIISLNLLILLYDCHTITNHSICLHDRPNNEHIFFRVCKQWAMNVTEKSIKLRSLRKRYFQLFLCQIAIKKRRGNRFELDRFEQLRTVEIDVTILTTRINWIFCLCVFFCIGTVSENRLA